MRTLFLAMIALWPSLTTEVRAAVPQEMPVATVPLQTEGLSIGWLWAGHRYDTVEFSSDKRLFATAKVAGDRDQNVEIDLGNVENPQEPTRSIRFRLKDVIDSAPHQSLLVRGFLFSKDLRKVFITAVVGNFESEPRSTPFTMAKIAEVDLQTNASHIFFQHYVSINQVKLVDQGRAIVVAYSFGNTASSRIELIDLASGKTRPFWGSSQTVFERYVETSADGLLIATKSIDRGGDYGRGRAQVWNTHTGEQVFEYVYPLRPGRFYESPALAMSGDNTKLAVMERQEKDVEVLILDLKTKQIVTRLKVPGQIENMAIDLRLEFSPDHMTVVVSNLETQQTHLFRPKAFLEEVARNTAESLAGMLEHSGFESGSPYRGGSGPRIESRSQIEAQIFAKLRPLFEKHPQEAESFFELLENELRQSVAFVAVSGDQLNSRFLRLNRKWLRQVLDGLEVSSHNASVLQDFVSLLRSPKFERRGFFESCRRALGE